MLRSIEEKYCTLRTIYDSLCGLERLACASAGTWRLSVFELDMPTLTSLLACGLVVILKVLLVQIVSVHVIYIIVVFVHVHVK